MNAGVFWGVQQPEAQNDGSAAAGGGFVHPARMSSDGGFGDLDDAALHTKLDELSDQLTAMVNHQSSEGYSQQEPAPVPSAAPASTPSPAPAPVPVAVAAEPAAPTTRSLIERIEQSEKTSSESLSAVNQKLSELGNRLQTLQDTATSVHAQPNNEKPEFESAIRNVMDQVQQAEKRNRDLMKALQDRMAELGARAAAAPDAQVSQSAPAIQDIERRLADLHDKLERREQHSDDSTRLSTIESKLAELSQGVEALPAASTGDVAGGMEAATYFAERIAAGEKPVDVATRDELANMESRIEELSRQFAATPAPGADTDRLRSDVTALTEQVRQIKASAASNRDVQSMRSSLESLTKVVSQKDGSEPLDALHQRINELAHLLQTSIPSQAERSKVGELEAKILQLDARLAAAQAQPDNTMAVKALEAQLKQVSDRLGEQEKRFAALSQIENSIAQLTSQLEITRTDVGRTSQQAAELEASITQLTSRMQTTRNEVTSSAESAAQRMADQIRMEVDVKSAQQVAAQPASGEVAALQQGLQAVQAQAQSTDKRTQDTLVAVHDTLDSVIERMNQIEAAKAAVAAASGLPDQSLTSVPPALPANTDGPAPQAATDPLTARMAVRPVAPEPATVSAVADQQPMFAAPNVGEAMQAQPVTPAVAAPEAPAAAASSSGGRQDFIAAAREAARAAGHTPTGPSAPGVAAQNANVVLGAPAAGLPASADADESGGQKKKKLILAGIVALLIGAATGYGVINYSKGPDPVMDAPLAVQPAPSSAPQQAVPDAGTQPAAIQPAETAPLDGAPLGADGTPPETDPAPDGVQPAESVPFDPTAPAQSNNLQGVTPLQADPIQTGSVSNLEGKGANLSTSGPAPTPVAKQLDPNITTIGKVDRSSQDSSLEALSVLSEQAKTAPVVQADPFVTGAIPNAATANVEEEPVQGSVSERIAAAGLPGALGPQGMLAAAVKGDKVAQFMVAARLSDGKAVPKDFQKASKWYHKAATKGLAPAQYRLGTLYERGRGVKKDLKTAKGWYEHAAHRGHIKAMHNIAVLMANGMDGQPKFSQAAYWFKKAANLGLKDSQYNLAILYQQGLGVQKDLNEAYRWYALAAKQKDKDAAKRMKLLAGKLGAADLKKARQLVETWRPVRAKFAANVVTPPIGGWADAAPAKSRSKPLALAPLPPDAVRQTQKMLNAIGFDAGVADGLMGPQTIKAIRTFQKQEGMEVTGSVSPELLRRLRNLPG
ncbi:MAG: peptidoglycan-binding protein [Pseudomonadota bacterium]